MVVTDPETQLTIGSRTDVGRLRDHNEDSIWAEKPADAAIRDAKGVLLIVADGMGGHAAGELASKIAISTMVREYYAAQPGDIPHALQHAVELANQAIYDEAARDPAKRGMGTTCIATVIHNDIAYVLNVGDSRLYRLRQGRLEQLTQDHSWVMEQVRAGILTADEAASHPYKNIVTRSLGPSPHVEPDLTKYELDAGDVLLLCSDGLDVAVPDEQIRHILEANPDPTAAAGELVRQANNNGGPDNISVIVVCVEQVRSGTGESLVEHGANTNPFPATVTAGLDTVPLEEDGQIVEPVPEPMPRLSRRLIGVGIALVLGLLLILFLFRFTFSPVQSSQATPTVAAPATATVVPTPTMTITPSPTATVAASPTATVSGLTVATPTVSH